MTLAIDLNADIGELAGPEGRALDAGILDAVTSCNIACGGHAGDAQSMRETLKMACEKGVTCGAHPSYPDREGFGRRAMEIASSELGESLKTQVSALLIEAKALGVSVAHLKPHGALYNTAAKSAELADMIASITRDSGIPNLVGPPASELEAAAQRAEIGFIGEGFADRSYETDGALTPRSEIGAVHEDETDQIKQALTIADGYVLTRNGKRIELPVQTICVHGDTPGAQRAAMAIRDALLNKGITLGLSR